MNNMNFVLAVCFTLTKSFYICMNVPLLFIKRIVCVLHVTGRFICRMAEINRIYHRSLMQIEKSIPEGHRIMPETWLGFLDPHGRPVFDYIFTYAIKSLFIIRNFFNI